MTDEHENTAALTPARGRPVVKSKEARRSEILDIAYHIFVEEGYASMTMEAVVALAKTSKRTLYAMFPDRASLFSSLVLAHRRRMYSPPPRGEAMPSIEVALATAFDVHFDQERYPEKHRFLGQVMLDSRQYPELLLLVRKFGIDRTRDELAGLLLEWLPQLGTIEDAIHSAAILMEMIFGPICNPYTSEGFLPYSERKEHARQCIAIFLRGTLAGRKF